MKLKDYLKTRGIKQSSLAKAIDVDTVKLCRYVNNIRRPDINFAKKIKEISNGVVTEYDEMIHAHELTDQYIAQQQNHISE